MGAQGHDRNSRAPRNGGRCGLVDLAEYEQRRIERQVRGPGRRAERSQQQANGRERAARKSHVGEPMENV